MNNEKTKARARPQISWCAIKNLWQESHDSLKVPGATNRLFDDIMKLPRE